MGLGKNKERLRLNQAVETRIDYIPTLVINWNLTTVNRELYAKCTKNRTVFDHRMRISKYIVLFQKFQDARKKPF